jgi:hypothetical protein
MERRCVASFTAAKATRREAKLRSGRYTCAPVARTRFAPDYERLIMVMSLRSALRLAPLALAVALAGCTTSGGGPVQVTRFHLAEPIAPGSFSIESVPMAGPGAPLAPDNLELATYGDMVAAELTHLGFSRTTAGSSELIVTVAIDRGSRPDYNAGGSSVSLGIGGASFGRHSAFGGGVGTTVPIGRQEHFIVGTRMQVQIKRRSDGTAIWEGRAMTQAKGQSPDASPQAAATKLSHGLFVGFPGESGRTITVK